MSGGQAEDDAQRIGVTVVTGYLGAGKTTLVNRVLAAEMDRRYAVIVNEFGDVGVDGDLIDNGREELIELSNGCICCVVRGDLIRTLRDLLRRRGDLDGLLIETTGLANPAPVIQTFFADPVLLARCRLDSVTTVVDAAHFADQLKGDPTVAEQVALADRIILNKADAPGADAVEAALRRLNPLAPITRAQRCDVDIQALLAQRNFDLDRLELPEDPDADAHDHGHGDHGHHHHHDGHDHHHHDHHHDHGHDHAPDPLHDHVAAAGISSVTCLTAHALDADKLEAWLQDLLARQGPDILRTKGILPVAGEDRRLVIQAVNMMLEGDFTAPWKAGEDRKGKLVFIGRNLDGPALQAGLDSCRAD